MKNIIFKERLCKVYLVLCVGQYFNCIIYLGIYHGKVSTYKNYICLKQWRKTENSHKKINYNSKGGTSQKALIAYRNAIYH